jgi:hypothetical protein
VQISMGAVVYHLWGQHNARILEGQIKKEESIIHAITWEVKS